MTQAGGASQRKVELYRMHNRLFVYLGPQIEDSTCDRDCHQSSVKQANGIDAEGRTDEWSRFCKVGNQSEKHDQHPQR